MDKMMKEISKYPNGTYLIIKWEDGQEVYGKIDTIYESNNGLNEEEKGYKEFYVCLVRIEKIIGNSKKLKCNENKLIEISIENQPILITLQDGSILWKKY